MKKIALILSGCGNKDGSEITEAVSLLIALHQHGAIVSRRSTFCKRKRGHAPERAQTTPATRHAGHLERL